VLRFYWRLIKRTPVFFWRALTGLDKVAGALALLFGAIGIGAWSQLLPLWTPFAAYGVILLYSFLRANYEEYIAVEGERDALIERLETAERRKALNDLLGDALKEGRSLGGGRRYSQAGDEGPNAHDRYLGEVHG